MFDELLEMFERNRKRPTGERKRGLGGLIERLSGDDRDDVRSDQRRSAARDDDRDDDRYDTRSDHSRSDERDDHRDDNRARRRREFELWDD